MAAPFIPKIGIKNKFKNNKIINENPHHLKATFSLPDILIIEPTDPKLELIIGINIIIKKVVLGIKKSLPKNTTINFS